MKVLPSTSSSREPRARAMNNGLPPTATVYERLGKEKGVDDVVTDFLARVVADPKINGYFLNSTLESSH